MGPDAQEPAFVLQPGRADGSAQWVVGPPRDRYGDGIGVTFVSRLHDDGLSAVVEAEVDGSTDGFGLRRLPAFVATLAEGWRGWDGVRRWSSLDQRLLLDARHDGRGHVELEVGFQRCGPRGEIRWTAQAFFRIEAGEELTRVAADLSDALGA